MVSMRAAVMHKTSRGSVKVGHERCRRFSGHQDTLLSPQYQGRGISADSELPIDVSRAIDDDARLQYVHSTFAMRILLRCLHRIDAPQCLSRKLQVNVIILNLLDPPDYPW